MIHFVHWEATVFILYQEHYSNTYSAYATAFHSAQLIPIAFAYATRLFLSSVFDFEVKVIRLEIKHDTITLCNIAVTLQR